MKVSPVSKLTLVETVAAAITDRIASRQLMPGARLPSVRAFAEAMGVSKSTVVEAYDRLGAEGAIVARRGSGFYVAGKTRPLCLKAVGPQLDRAVDPLWITRQSMQAGPDLVMPGSGWLPSAWMPERGDPARPCASSHAVRRPTWSHTTSPSAFHPYAHRSPGAWRRKGSRPAPIRSCWSIRATQALDLLCRFLLEAGDTVLVDDPCYFNYHGLLRAQRARVVGVPMTPNGPDLATLAMHLAEHRPRFYLTNSALQNPTGSILAPGGRPPHPEAR